MAGMGSGLLFHTPGVLFKWIAILFSLFFCWVITLVNAPIKNPSGGAEHVTMYPPPPLRFPDPFTRTLSRGQDYE